MFTILLVTTKCSAEKGGHKAWLPSLGVHQLDPTMSREQLTAPHVHPNFTQVNEMEITSFVVSGRVKAKDFGDYGTYRTQLSNRIHNLRTKLGIATKVRAKYSSKAPITAEDIAGNHE